MKRWQINIAYGSSTGLKHDAKIIFGIVKRHFPYVTVREFNGASHPAINVWALMKKIGSSLFFRKKQITFHIEEIYKEVALGSSFNVLFPNQEWLRSGTQAAISSKTFIFCKTEYALNQLAHKWPHAEYTGFTSIDYHDSGTEKDFTRFLHVAGKSEQKGTLPLINAWRKHPEWPKLTVVSRRPEHARYTCNNIEIVSEFLPHADLVKLMNTCGVHLCPSEAEGFGHSINEALSTGAVIAVTDAAPMNEFGHSPFLFSVAEKSTRYFSSINKCSTTDIEKTVTSILAHNIDTLRVMGTQNRVRYLETMSVFESTLIKRLEGMMAR